MRESTMQNVDRTETWQTLVVRGIAPPLFGTLTFLWPGISVAALVLLFSASAFVDGGFNLSDAFTNARRDGPRGRLTESR
jgi:uncharacterized membrane protein HdeD (DUF308 family)